MKKLLVLQVLMIAASIAMAVYYYPLLPSRMPIHWNVRGMVDNWAPKAQAVWMMPVITLLLFAGFFLVPKLDPKKDKYRLFAGEWQIIRTAFVGFFTYMQFVTIRASLFPGTNIMPLMFVGLGALFILLGNYLSKIRQNYFLGIKVPWTLSSEDNWNKTHRYASWTFVMAGVITLAEAYFIWFAAPVIFGVIMLAAFLPVLYSFLLFKKKAYLMRYVHIGLAVVFVIVLFLRGVSGEDDWICQKGKWVKHGNPKSAAPAFPCR